MKTPSLIFVISLLSAFATSYASARLGGGSLGSYTRLPDLEDDHVQDIAKYAVTEHNIKAGTQLEYLKIVSGEYQVVAGNNFRLVISAKQGDAVNNYQAIVFDKPWDMTRELVSFNAV